MTDDQYKYRGIPIDSVSGFINGNGLLTIASVKDIENIGAGYKLTVMVLEGVGEICFRCFTKFSLS